MISYYKYTRYINIRKVKTHFVMDEWKILVEIRKRFLSNHQLFYYSIELNAGDLFQSYIPKRTQVWFQKLN